MGQALGFGVLGPNKSQDAERSREFRISHCIDESGSSGHNGSFFCSFFSATLFDYVVLLFVCFAVFVGVRVVLFSATSLYSYKGELPKVLAKGTLHPEPYTLNPKPYQGFQGSRGFEGFAGLVA